MNGLLGGTSHAKLMTRNDIALQLNSFTSDSQFTSRRDSKFELNVMRRTSGVNR